MATLVKHYPLIALFFMTDSFFKAWAGKSTSGNRSDSSYYLSRKSLETYHTLSDFFNYNNEEVADLGCGSGELLVYLLDNINITIGIDYSQNMLKKCASLIHSSHKDVRLICSDVTDLKCLNVPYWISTGALSQYLPEAKLRLLLSNFLESSTAEHLILFDTIDPILFYLYKFISYDDIFASSSCRTNAIDSLKSKIFHMRLRLLSILSSYNPTFVQLLPGDLTGYGVKTSFWRQSLANSFCNIKLISSREFEYRYHVLISKTSPLK